jgi:hypothetical protein
LATLAFERVAIATGRVNTARAMEEIIADIRARKSADGSPLGADPHVRQKGAVMHESGELDHVTDVRHDLAFDGNLDLRAGLVEITTETGAVYRVDTDASAGGGYMSGGGYGGWHGRPMGRDHIEHDVYPLDGSTSPRTLDSALTDRLAAFTWEETPGRGIFEFALTRSRSYAYRPTLGSGG